MINRRSIEADSGIISWQQYCLAAQTMAMPMPVAPPPPTDAPSLRAAYGAPDFVRREADAELWRYNGMNCTAFFFLYRDGEVWRLRYSETMPHGRDAPADPTCIAGLSARAMS